MAFLRAGANPQKMVESLVPMFQRGGHARTELFRMWLDKGRDFASVEVEVTRRNSQQAASAARDKAMSRRDLEQCGRYNEQDIAELIERKTRLGHYINDPNFPDRVDLRQYLVNNEVMREVRHVREDSQSVTSRTALNGNEAVALTENGMEFDGTGPNVGDVVGGGLSAAPVPAVQPPSADPTSKTKAKPKRKPKAKAAASTTNGEAGEADTEVVTPPTALEKAKKLEKAVFLGFVYSIQL